MLRASWHVHLDDAFLFAETPCSVSDWCVVEALVQLPPLETARLSFTALACFSSFLLHCQCALSDLASPARLSFGVAVELAGMT